MSVTADVKAACRRVVPTGWWRRLQRLKLAAQRVGYRRRVVSHLYGGHQLTIHLADRVGALWYGQAVPMPDVALLSTGRLRPGATVFNIGAHQGVVALVLGREVGDRGRVVAVEADRFHARIAEINRRLNRVDHVHVLSTAAGAAPGGVWHDPTTGAMLTGGGGVPVDVVTIDQLADQWGQPDVIVMDVEGYEADVLSGARRVLAAGAVDVLVEVHRDWLSRYGKTVLDVYDALPADRYFCTPQDEAAAPPGRFQLHARGRAPLLARADQ